MKLRDCQGIQAGAYSRSPRSSRNAVHHDRRSAPGGHNPLQLRGAVDPLATTGTGSRAREPTLPLPRPTRWCPAPRHDSARVREPNEESPAGRRGASRATQSVGEAGLRLRVRRPRQRTTPFPRRVLAASARDVDVRSTIRRTEQRLRSPSFQSKLLQQTC